ncbi:DUF418 domain-containing protein [uncultured Brevundimonas sp.]|uniref:DUF418 domain-containing protein n=1 Tax=uncultured Brevundimonas sp. TaxID=213418 RepID=UPI0025D0EB30|nr:DUF418 domain-containing protein [uncultured Brevundimonas sp.]
MDASASPPSRERIATLDLIRGLAVLGILAVNAEGFAATFSAYGSPGLWPFPNVGASAAAKWIIDAFFHQKFISLFSMLFGASIFLVGGERDERGAEDRGRRLRRRLFWLFVFALFHGLALWWGDVLLLYAWSGVFVMLARSWSVRRLAIVGGLLFGLFAALQILGGLALQFAPPEVQTQVATTMQATPERLAAIRAEIAEAAGSLAGAYRQNTSGWMSLQAPSVMVFVFPTTGLMMIGLALFKAGFLSGARSMRAYAVALVAAAAALVVVARLEWGQVMNGAESPLAGGVDFLLNPLIGLGYASVLILLWKAGHARALSPLAAAGRMAFTNYLTQSLIMTTLFYGGRGFGLMGQVDRPALWAIVVAVWALQLVWSVLWLRRFQMGPLEWLWRSLTEGRRLPIRRTA